MIIVIISFILDNIFSRLIKYSNLLYPLFSLLSLILIYPYFNRKDNNYYIFSFIFGLIYDITYTDTIFLSAFIFLSISYLLRLIFNKFNYNYLSVLLSSIFIIIYFRLVTYLILVLLNYLNFNIITLISSIYSSLILNIIYILLVYILLNKKILIFKTK